MDQTRAAIRDLESRTLANLKGDITRLVYLSSTRDYNTGQYQHEGLAVRYGRAAAEAALAECHRNIFDHVLGTNLSGLVSQLEQYIDSTGEDRERVLDAWQRLEAYRVLTPRRCAELEADFFASNVKIALGALRAAAPVPGN
ncbi:MAG TPA: hypothetical protein VGF59_11370 [Bryobacteraceae bacterium]|jgi:hypothetical protein